MDARRKKKIVKLIDACWKHHAWVKRTYPDVLPGMEMPILWFGDLVEYDRSPRKIVTVGLNPSLAEFQEGKRPTPTSAWSMHRFCEAEAVAKRGRLKSSADYSAYQDSLNHYFREYSNNQATAYKVWFSNWKGILHCLNASFDSSERKSTAIHIDFCTPIATIKKWGDRDFKEKAVIADHAAQSGLWKSLIDVLCPDLILTCISRSYIDSAIESLKWKQQDCVDNQTHFCHRSPAHKTVHASGWVKSHRIHLFAAPAGSPWKGWYKCQIKDFAKQIENAVWKSRNDTRSCKN